MTPVEWLNQVGPILYGKEGKWWPKMAADLGIAEKSLFQWKEGRNTSFTWSHPAIPAIREMLDEHVKRAQRLRLVASTKGEHHSAEITIFPK